jgi:putative polyketide hydroxylase
LRSHAERRGADIRFSTQLVSAEQQNDGVTGHIRDLRKNKQDAVYAHYLVVADGANGTIRQQLGIERRGPGVLQHWINVIFDTDLKPSLDGRRITSVFVEDINGTFVPREGASRWLMAVQYVPERGERAEDFTPERCVELIRTGAGREDIRAEIVDVRPWEMSAYTANQFSVGRGFLVGDTAHVIPPTGGFGGNTGIHDSHNLAWKLDAVLRGVAGPPLLDTYDCERRPIAEGTLAQALARLQAWFTDPTKKLPPAEPIVDDLCVVFGQRYNDGALITEDSSTSAPAFENPRTPSG